MKRKIEEGSDEKIIKVTRIDKYFQKMVNINRYICSTFF